MKLIAIDLDGTLLSSTGSISQENIEAIHQVQELGHVVMISSGRSLHDTKEIIQHAGIDCPIITGNGAIAFESGKVIQNLIMEEKVIEELVDRLQREGYYFEIYTNKGILILENGRGILNREIQSIQNQDESFSVEWATGEIDIQYKQNGLHLISDCRGLNFASLEVYKIFVLSFNRVRLLELKERLSERTDLSLTSSGKTKLEIAHPHTSKGNALKMMANYLNIPMKDTVAIGDNLNDFSMFEAAGMSIAMGNAEDEVKERSMFITKDHDENGVGYALKECLLKSSNSD
ncbi:Cof subfamily protein (haloacid dehalogenase superfamily) [Bacillus pakistanensis]|uniref:Cof subfamily protein (Haloacid dehalogenase superfamily) n=1 Tax=Rossellomorea pakistanensis TaxID=992288 RepID=A0ABS2NHA8_9BACI|nr:Cof-type HAD-IIB family hydrolase [Bacillus pakistanensis]MBM7587244.1 Cof subfamily protein (haloacid dehalogenase superfamily) [Bacillus pakistanensis]